MKNLKWFLGLVLALTLFVWQTPTILAADDYNQNGNFGYYVPAWERGQVLGDTITICPPFDPQYCQSPGVVGKDSNGCGVCLVNQPNQNQPSQQQNNFSPCPSGQVYLCSGNTNPMAGANGLTCSGGGQPACGVLSNSQQPQNQNNQSYQPQQNQPSCPSFGYCGGKIVRKDFNGVMCDVCDSTSQPNQNNQQYQPWADMCKDNTALACVDGSGKFIASAKVGSDGKPVCPTNSSAQCGNYQQNNQQNQNKQQNGQPGQMMGQNQQGPSDEEMAKQQAQQLKKMQTDVKKIPGQLNNIKKTIASAQKLKIAIPAELTTAMANIENFANTVKNAKNMDDLESDINPGDEFAIVNEYAGFLNQEIGFFKNMLPQAKKNFKTYQTAYTRLAKNKKSNPDALAGLKVEIDKTTTALAQIEAEAKVATDADSFDSVVSALGDIYDVNFPDIITAQQQVDFLLNYTSGIKSLTATVNNFTKAISQADKKKLDTASAKEELAQLQQLFKDLKAAANTKPVDIEDLTSRMSDFADAVDQLRSTLEDLGVMVNGINNIALPQMSQQPQQPQNNFQMPSSFNYGPQQPQGPQITPNNQGGPNQDFNNQGGPNQGQQMAPGTF